MVDGDPIRPLVFDVRRARAEQMTAFVMLTIGKYITDHEQRFPQRASRDLFEAFYTAGIDTVSDHDRAQAGLPPRGREGWTQQELAIIESARVMAILKPIVGEWPTRHRKNGN